MLTCRRDPESRLTEMLGRIWQEYPGGMLDITEEELERREVDENDTEDHTEKPSIDKQDDKGMIMSFEDMTQMRETILAQLKSVTCHVSGMSLIIVNPEMSFGLFSNWPRHSKNHLHSQPILLRLPHSYLKPRNRPKNPNLSHRQSHRLNHQHLMIRSSFLPAHSVPHPQFLLKNLF